MRPPLDPMTVAAYQAAGIPLQERAQPQAPAGSLDVLRELVGRLEALSLRTRPPGWQEPPRSAVNLRWCINDDLIGAGVGGTSSRTWGVRWNATPESATAGSPPGFSTLNLTDSDPEPFQDGYVGVVWVECTAAQVSSAFAAVNVIRQARWSLLHNGGFVPGFLRAMPGGNVWNSPSIAAFVANAHGMHRSITAAPLIVRGNDTMQVVFTTDEINGGVTVNFHCSVVGWKVPASDFDRELAAIRG